MVKDIIRIKFADTFLTENQIFSGGSFDKKIPIIFSFFLIVTDTKKILVDTGCEDMEGFVLENFKHPVAALKEYGYTSDNITDVIITHAHHDHIGCVEHFNNAKVHIQQSEYTNGKSYLDKCSNVIVFDEHIEIEDVRVIKIGGHSAGSCIVECPMNNKNFVLCGDECYTRYNLAYKVPTAASCNKEKSAEFVSIYSQDKYICLLTHEE